MPSALHAQASVNFCTFICGFTASCPIYYSIHLNDLHICSCKFYYCTMCYYLHCAKLLELWSPATLSQNGMCWEVLVPQPNKTKPPLQVLAVAEGNSEKNKVWDETHDGVIINQNLSTRIRHHFFLISYWHLVWSLAQGGFRNSIECWIPSEGLPRRYLTLWNVLEFTYTFPMTQSGFPSILSGSPFC